MLTRHFYESEEVELALSYAIMRGRHVEAAFWCEELLCSNEEDRVWGVLYRTWLEQCLVVLPDWADTWLSAETDIHEACAELCDACRTRRDVSLPVVLLLGVVQQQSCEPPEGVLAAAAAAAASAAGGSLLEDMFLHACSHGQAQAAWWAAQKLGPAAMAAHPLPSAGPRLFAYLSTLDLPGAEGGWRAATLCAAILLQCLEGLGKGEGICGKYTRKGPRAPLEEIAAWRAIEGRRERRAFTVPRECLLCVTPRGRTTSATSTLPLLHTAHERILRDEGCACWSKLLKKTKPHTSDDALEAFYARAFPDDIPDEWSKEDHAKSHGPGSLARTEEPRWSKWARLWLEANALFVSGISATSLVTALSVPHSPEHWLDSLYAAPPRHSVGMDGELRALMTYIQSMKLVEE